MRLTDILRAKGNHVATIAPESTIRDLVDLLARDNIGAVVVSHDGTSIEGIVSERDVVRRLRDADAGVLDAAVSTIMTSTVYSAKPDDDVRELARSMTQHRIRHMPVVDDDQLAGIVSIGDVVKSRIDELEFERNQLEGYITGT